MIQRFLWFTIATREELLCKRSGTFNQQTVNFFADKCKGRGTSFLQKRNFYFPDAIKAELFQGKMQKKRNFLLITQQNRNISDERIGRLMETNPTEQRKFLFCCKSIGKNIKKHNALVYVTHKLHICK